MQEDLSEEWIQLMKMKRFRNTVVAVAAVAALACAVTAVLPAVRGTEAQLIAYADRTLLGLHMGKDFADTMPAGDQGWVRNHRVEVRWEGIERNRDVYRWGKLDDLVGDILASGSESILFLLGGPVPAWARDTQYGGFASVAPPKNLADWYDFCAAVAERYGSVVDFYEIWNEPGWDRDSQAYQIFGIYHFGGQVETEYLSLLQLAHAAIKEKDPTGQVMCGALMYSLTDVADVGEENYALLFDELNRPGQDVSIKVTSPQPIVAERPMYFNYNATWAGGHDAMGTSAAQNEWLFAEGCTGFSIQEYLCLQNPNASAVGVELTFMMSKGETLTRKAVLPPRSRTTLDINRLIGFSGSCDMIAIHPYKSPVNWGGFYANVAGTLRSRGVVHEVAATEIGWPHYSESNPAAHNEANQAQALGDGVKGLFDNGCKKIWVFRDIDEPPGAAWDGNYYGLFAYTGSPLQAWYVYCQWQSQLPSYGNKPSTWP